MTCYDAYRIYREAAGLQRLGKVVRSALNHATAAAVRQGRLVQVEGRPKAGQIYRIVHVPGTPEYRIRPRGDRPIDQIPRNEVRALAEQVRERLGVDGWDSILRLVLDHYDVRRVSRKIRELFEEHLDPWPPAENRRNDDELSDIEVIQKVCAEDWLRLSHWAKVNELFEGWERGMLYSVGSRLIRGESPTRKQSVHARRVLESALDRGFELSA